METALRETEEEAGLKASQFDIVADFRKELHYVVKQKPKIVVYWLAKLTESNAAVTLSDEHRDFRWAKLEEACHLAEYPDLQSLLRESEAYIKNGSTLI